jgi:hypothetical protein
MMFHDRGTVNIADVVRYVVTYEPALDPAQKHGFLSHIASASHAPIFQHKVHLRIRNNASMLLRAAYLQGPYVLAVAVREDTFHADDEESVSRSSLAPVYDQDLKASTSFWAELPVDKRCLLNRVRLIVDVHGSLRLLHKQYSPTRQLRIP